MTWHNVKDHEHDFHRVDRRPSEWGVTIKYECSECDYWRSEFTKDRQAGLDSFP